SALGLRASAFKATAPQPSPPKEERGKHPRTKAGGDANRNAGFIRQPKCDSSGCRINPAFRWW
ncbi:MAG: hypothetical protein WCQ21_17940, partial [Verrucomicrobiota bacterium]